jgi:DNA-binding MarR family transcriptional regulator
MKHRILGKVNTELVPDADVEAVMRASRVLIAIAARSLVDVEDIVTLSQWRVLVLISTRGPQTPGLVAEDLGVHPSNATRICDRLVKAGLVEKQENAADRRVQQIALTDAGGQLIEGIMARRRTMINAVMDDMEPHARATLASVFGSFAAAAGELAREPIPGILGLGG